MKRLILLLCFVGLSRPVTAEPISLDFNRMDTVAHFTTSYGATLTGTLILEHYKVKRLPAILFSVASVLAVGIAKEAFIDSEFSWSDTAANTLGAGLSVGMVIAFDL